jgi:hypothetical protein
METAAFHVSQLNIEHRAATGIGAKIEAEAVLEALDRRFCTVRVSARAAALLLRRCRPAVYRLSSRRLGLLTRFLQQLAI